MEISRLTKGERTVQGGLKVVGNRVGVGVAELWRAITSERQDIDRPPPMVDVDKCSVV